LTVAGNYAEARAKNENMKGGSAASASHFCAQ